MTNEEMAREILTRLRGYTQRQAWAMEDQAVLVELLDCWDAQVDERDSSLRERYATCEALEERVRSLEAENAELRTQTGLKGVLSYLKVRSGLA